MDLNSTLEDMLGCALEGGELLLKSGLKQEKLSVRPYCFKTALKFFTRVEGGGSEAPIRRMARWGLQTIRHGTSFIKFNFNPRVCFLRLLFHSSYEPSYVKHILSGVKNSNDSIETRHDNFSTCRASC